ncbi:hypothetical protein VPNG_01446 [Cytospora leucostoma]|uniref:Apple domain-containing protein n=1 Tax=Cytospora leucostoma TaxID=1230097 RepID=A0A423XJV4_9PEZI|nr:hypothetical protein VPNG_01446 [Cytospora leucostoma]
MLYVLWAATALAALTGIASTAPTVFVPSLLPVCAAETPVGLGPTVSPDTPAAFLAYSPFAANAIATTNIAGFTIEAINYQARAERTNVTTMGWLNLPNYDVTACSGYCTNTLGCLSFDVFYQRSPTIVPSYNTSCPDPPSMTSVICTIYSAALTTADMINTGETRGQFVVVIAGSNLFNKVVP